MKLYLHSLNNNSKDIIKISEIEVIEISGIPINEILYGWCHYEALWGEKL